MKQKPVKLLCRTCLQIINQSNQNDETHASDCSKTVKEQLALCLPDLNLEDTKNFVICAVCSNRLSIVYKYFSNCMKVERIITESIKNNRFVTPLNWIQFCEVITPINIDESKQLQIRITNGNGTNLAESQDDAIANPSETDAASKRAAELITLRTLLEKPLDTSIPNTTIGPNDDDDEVIFIGTVDDETSTTNKTLPQENPVTNENNVEADKGFTCRRCKAHFKTRKCLTIHFISVHMKTFSCDWCNYSNRSFGLFKMHLQRHFTTPKMYKCSMCSGMYESKALLDKHFKMHLICLKCGQAFPLLELLMQHLPTCMVTNGYVNIGRICNSTFKAQTDLDVHALTHKAQPPQCDNCFDCFANDEALLLHLQICNVVSAISIPFEANGVNQLEWINYDQQPTFVHAGGSFVNPQFIPVQSVPNIK